MTFYIGDRQVGGGVAPLVIVEIGINHGGDLNVAKEMVDAAVASGAEVIKHQTHIIEDEMSPAAEEIQPVNADRSIYQLMSECALDEEQERELQAYCTEKGVIFISTPFSRAAVERLDRMNVPAYKIGSGECNNLPLLRHIAAKGKPIIMSTGMNSLEDLVKPIAILREYKVPFALLHCTNLYPTPPELVRLEAIRDLKESFPDAVVGLSDHTINHYTCLGAVALGADILERHFTDSKDRVGPDIVCSMDPEELKSLIEGSIMIQKARGGSKTRLAEEQCTADFAFASVVAIEDIAEGQELSLDNIWVKRPGTGEIHAEHFEDLITRTTSKAIVKGQQLKWSDLHD